MSRRTGAARLAWSICALSLTLAALSLLLLALSLSHPDVHVDFWVENTLVSVSFSIIGATTGRSDWRGESATYSWTLTG
jgi:uncharacterized membrane protein